MNSNGSHAPNDKRTLLKRILSAGMDKAQFTRALSSAQGHWIFTCMPGNLFSGHGYSNITKGEIKEMASEEDVVFLLEEV